MMSNDENKSSKKWSFYFWNSKMKDPKFVKVVNALDLVSDENAVVGKYY